MNPKTTPAEIPDWDEHLKVGHVVLDEQHETMLAMCRRAGDCLRKGYDKDLAVLCQILDELVVYATAHFDTEERFLRECNSPLLPQQVVEHNQFIDTIANFQVEVARGRIDKIPMSQFLAKWLVNHFIKSDMQYRDLVETSIVLEK